MRPTTFSGAALVAGLTISLSISSARADKDSPDRVSEKALKELAHRTSGVILGEEIRGSGTVSGNPQIVISCAHVAYQGAWLQGLYLAPGYTGREAPSGKATRLLRGNYHWADYNGGNFAQDFVIHYAYANLAGGAYHPFLYNDSTKYHQLSGGAQKMVVGYPGSDYFYQNVTGPFTGSYLSEDDSFYFWHPYVRAGAGMSGGGIFVKSGSDWRLAGVHLSGLGGKEQGAGARPLDRKAYYLFCLSTYATKSSVGRPSLKKHDYRADPGLVLMDAPESGSTPVTPPTSGEANTGGSTTAKLKVERAPNAVYSAHVTVRITHPSRNELEVQLTSPSGKSVMLYNQPKAKGANLTVSMDVSSAFRNLEANGEWSVHVRDTKTGNVGKLDWMTLRLTGF